MKTQDLSTQATEVYNVMLELSWGEPYITFDHIQKATGLGRSRLASTLAELVSASKVLAGNEEALGSVIETYTPKVKGVAYGYPLDYFKGYSEWMENKL
tara:strand:- start:114 stop:410 length:297 start_codon:yes stop_codon:yes gene_type:complete